MDAYWHPVCPTCRQQVSTVAFPGDERGPMKLDQYSLGNLFCSNQRCARMVDLRLCTEWKLERLWNDGQPVVARMIGWGTLPTHAEDTFNY